MNLSSQFKTVPIRSYYESKKAKKWLKFKKRRQKM